MKRRQEERKEDGLRERARMAEHEITRAQPRPRSNMTDEQLRVVLDILPQILTITITMAA